jgi:hypothetical protein
MIERSPVECLPMGNQLHDTSPDPEPIIADLRPGLRTAERDETVEQQTATAGVLQSSIPRPATSRARVGRDTGQGDAPVREGVAQVLDERDLSGRAEPV